MEDLLATQPHRRPVTAAESVAASLRRAILNGELQAGTRLSLAEVAAGMQVSATPVREALRELSFEGLVQFDSYRGGMVNAVSESDVREIIRIRQVLEPMAIQEAVEHMTPEIIDRAEGVLAAMNLAAGWNKWVEDNRAFHNLLYSPSPSRRLIAMIKSLQDATIMFVSNALASNPDRRETADREHRELLVAFRSGDVDRAVEITLHHLALPLPE